MKESEKKLRNEREDRKELFYIVELRRRMKIIGIDMYKKVNELWNYREYLNPQSSLFKELVNLDEQAFKILSSIDHSEI